jgi:hypothetical protein
VDTAIVRPRWFALENALHIARPCYGRAVFSTERVPQTVDPEQLATVQELSIDMQQRPAA